MMDFENGFKQYCIVVLSRISGVPEELKKIAEGEIRNTAGGSGIYIATFTSMLNAQEITEYFRDNDRLFILSEVDGNKFGANLGKLHDKLFTFSEDVDDLTEQMVSEMRQVSGTTETTNTTIDVTKLKESEREDLLNELIDKGLDNLSEEEKEILNKISIL